MRSLQSFGAEKRSSRCVGGVAVGGVAVVGAAGAWSGAVLEAGCVRRPVSGVCGRADLVWSTSRLAALFFNFVNCSPVTLDDPSLEVWRYTPVRESKECPQKWVAEEVAMSSVALFEKTLRLPLTSFIGNECLKRRRDAIGNYGGVLIHIPMNDEAKKLWRDPTAGNVALEVNARSNYSQRLPPEERLETTSKSHFKVDVLYAVYKRDPAKLLDTKTTANATGTTATGTPATGTPSTGTTASGSGIPNGTTSVEGSVCGQTGRPAIEMNGECVAVCAAEREVGQRLRGHPRHVYVINRDRLVKRAGKLEKQKNAEDKTAVANGPPAPPPAAAPPAMDREALENWLLATQSGPLGTCLTVRELRLLHCLTYHVDPKTGNLFAIMPFSHAWAHVGNVANRTYEGYNTTLYKTMLPFCLPLREVNLSRVVRASLWPHRKGYALEQGPYIGLKSVLAFEIMARASLPHGVCLHGLLNFRTITTAYRVFEATRRDAPKPFVPFPFQIHLPFDPKQFFRFNRLDSEPAGETTHPSSPPHLRARHKDVLRLTGMYLPGHWTTGILDPEARDEPRMLNNDQIYKFLDSQVIAWGNNGAKSHVPPEPLIETNAHGVFAHLKYIYSPITQPLAPIEVYAQCPPFPSSLLRREEYRPGVTQTPPPRDEPRVPPWERGPWRQTAPVTYLPPPPPATHSHQPSPYMHQPSTHTHPPPTHVHPTPTYMQPTPTYMQPASTCVQRASTYMQPASTYMQPTASYIQPASTYVQPSSTYMQPGSMRPLTLMHSAFLPQRFMESPHPHISSGDYARNQSTRPSQSFEALPPPGLPPPGYPIMAPSNHRRYTRRATPHFDSQIHD